MFDRALLLLREPVRWLPWLLALLPAVWMAAFVLQGSHLQYNDYWVMLPRAVTSSGGLDLDGLATFQNEHPVVIPQLLYWVNVHLSGGSNVVLGLIVVAIVFAQVVLISTLVRPADRREWAAASTVVVASVLLFSQHGVWNFSKSMSGAAWLTANLFVVGAIVARSRDKVWLSAGLGVAASVSYATGLVVWPVLVIVGMLRTRRWLPDWRIVVVAVLPIAFYIVRRPDRDTVLQSDLWELVQTALAMGSSIFTASTGVMRAGTAIGLLLGLSLIALATIKREDAAIPWIGLTLYAFGCMILISRGRVGVTSGEWFPSRYASLSALFWIGVFGLAGTMLRWKWYMLVPAAALVVAAVTYDSPAVDEERTNWIKQRDLAAGLYLGLADDRAYVYTFLGTLDVGPLLEQLGHYPFSSAYDGDCGLIGTSYDPRSVDTATSGQIESVRRLTGSEGIRIVAELPDDLESDIRCVVVGDPAGEIVGIGTLGLGEQQGIIGMAPGSEDPTRLAAIAPLGSRAYRLLLVLDDGSLVQLGDTLRLP